MTLPNQQNLPIHYLSAVFGDVTNSYKFYWFLGILDSVALENKQQITIDSLLSKMIAEVWYPVHYFKLSFGKQDQVFQYAQSIKANFTLSDDVKKTEIAAFIFKNAITEVRPLGRYVPYRFLTPWFAADLRGMIDVQKNPKVVELSKIKDNLSLYYFDENETSIIINDDWTDYIKKHYSILQAFTYWHLLKYLQKNNPNVPNIIEKLNSPQARNLTAARNFWHIILENQEIRCIYSNQIMNKSDFSLDHFVPWSFVTHDLVWNLAPIPKNINSAKNNSLPSLKTYLDNFSNLQYIAFNEILNQPKNGKFIEDYVLLFNNDVREIQSLSKESFKQKINETITPLIQIATNTGFSPDWIYK